MADTKAIKILLTTYWSAKGWRDKPSVSSEDFEYAKSQGVMFDPVPFTHDKSIRWVREVLEQIKPEDVANTFLASLGTRRLELRSALGSYALMRHIPSHKFAGNSASCSLCEGYRGGNAPEDVNTLNFERFKWGGVRHTDPLYAWFDLTRFIESDQPKPTASDRDCLRKILQRISVLPPKSKVSGLVKEMAPLIEATIEERRTLVTILGYAGILQPRSQKSFFEVFVPLKEREDDNSDSDWDFPINLWRASDGVNRDALNFWFPKL